MAVPPNPDESLTQRALAGPLRLAIAHTFGVGLKDTALVGGTALAGYYACHRQSDDMDLFVASASAQTAAILAAKSLTSLGAIIDVEIQTPTYFHATAALDGHMFTIDIVLDANLHRVGQFHTTSSGITVADLETLLMMKTAAIVSRCSEKDLYDLLWLTAKYRRPSMASLVSLGKRYEGGLTEETLLISLTNAKLRVSACGFARGFGIEPPAVLRQIEAFRGELQQELATHLESAPAKNRDVAALVKRLRKLR